MTYIPNVVVKIININMGIYSTCWIKKYCCYDKENIHYLFKCLCPDISHHDIKCHDMEYLLYYCYGHNGSYYQ